MSATPSVTDEKHDPNEVKKSRFSKGKGKGKSKNILDEKAQDDAASGSTAVQAPLEFPPVPFTQLFRFSTKFDLALDALGLVCAAGAGAAQVFTFFFSRLLPLASSD